MSPRRWPFSWLTKGSAPPLDPDEYIEVEPRGEDTYNIVTRTLSDVRVLVPRRDFDRATQVLASLRQR